MGYRYYDKAGVAVRWPFGYGLSYTSFSYSDLKVDGRNVSVTVTNTGERSGEEAVLLFVANKGCEIHRPKRELKAFSKVALEKGEKKEVSFTLTERAFSIWNNGWVIPEGEYSVEVGGLTSPITVEGVHLEAPEWQKGSFFEGCQGKPRLEDLENATGRKYTPPALKKGSFTMDNTVKEMMPYSLMMKIMYKAVEMTVAKGFGGKKDYDNPDFKMLMEASAGAPLRNMQISGGIPDSVMQGLLTIANGHFFKGILRMMTK